MKKRTGSILRAAVATLLAGFLMPAGAQAQAPAQPPAPTPVENPAPTPSQPAAEASAPHEITPLYLAAATFDVLIVRPLALVVVPVGVAAFIPAALLTAPNGMDSLQTALDYFVTGPVNYVFRRPLGDF